MAKPAEGPEQADPDHPRFTYDLVGHAAAEEELLAACNSGRLAHAWLLSGPEGIGKATLAYRFARFLLNGGLADDGLFGEAAPALSLAVPEDCEAAHLIAAESHPDLAVVKRSWDKKAKRMRGEIVVDDVRGLKSFFALSASYGGWRVAIVDAADELNRFGQNALLKLLEEPPARSVILLVAHAPGRLVATLRSRCRDLALRPLTPELAAGLLAARIPGLDADEAATLARLADGSPGRALALAKSGGLALYHDMAGILGSLPELDLPALHALGEKARSRKGNEGAMTFGVITTLLERWLTRMIGAAARGQETTGDAAEAVPGEAAVMRSLAARASLDQWLEVWENVTRLTTRAQALNLDRKQVVLNQFFSLERAARGA